MSYPKSSTALLLVDPYNDFLVEGGKLYPALKESLNSVGLVPRLIKLVEVAHKHKIPIYFVPHRQYRPGDFEDFTFPTSSHTAARTNKAFELGSWGGQFHEKLQPDVAHGDVIVTEHFTASGFATTNLDLLLRKHGITHIVLAGLIANTCLETTGRYGVELGYHVTMLNDATADFSEAGFKAATEVNYAAFAHAVKKAEEWVKEVTGEGFSS